MKELMTMTRKVARFLALAVVVAIVAWIVFGGRIGHWLKGEPTVAAAGQQHSGHDAGAPAAAEPDAKNPGR